MDLLGASRMRAVSMETVPSRSTSVSIPHVRIATSHLHWEEGRAAMVCLASMAALLLCWAPVYIASTVHTASLLLNTPILLPPWLPFPPLLVCLPVPLCVSPQEDPSRSPKTLGPSTSTLLGPASPRPPAPPSKVPPAPSL